MDVLSICCLHFILSCIYISDVTVVEGRQGARFISAETTREQPVLRTRLCRRARCLTQARPQRPRPRQSEVPLRCPLPGISGTPPCGRSYIYRQKPSETIRHYQLARLIAPWPPRSGELYSQQDLKAFQKHTGSSRKAF